LEVSRWPEIILAVTRALRRERSFRLYLTSSLKFFYKARLTQNSSPQYSRVMFLLPMALCLPQIFASALSNETVSHKPVDKTEGVNRHTVVGLVLGPLLLVIIISGFLWVAYYKRGSLGSSRSQPFCEVGHELRNVTSDHSTPNTASSYAASPNTPSLL